MLAPLVNINSFDPILKQRVHSPFSSGRHRLRAFTLVEIMVVVVIIGLLAAAALPTYRHITMRSKMTAVVNDLRAYSTALITYNLQNGRWPADTGPQQIPVEMAGALPVGFTMKTPIGGVYEWDGDVSTNGFYTKAAITIEGTSDFPMTDDIELLEMIDREMDDGNLSTGNIRLGSTNALVFIIEQ
jgi:prepilin-type N-terminal cleavage/methylation domain-containing protein